MAERGKWGRKLFAALAVVFVLGCAGLAWMERSTLLTWYYLRGLAGAAEEDRPRWLERVASLGEVALPGLLESLKQSDARPCGNARAALERLSQVWGVDDPLTGELAQRLARDFGQFSAIGQREILELAAAWFAESGPRSAILISACSRLVGEAAAATDNEIQASALSLCDVLLNQPERRGEEAVEPARNLIRVALSASTVNNRLQAVRLTLHRSLDLLDQVAGLLSDESALVRRAALLVVGPARDAVHDDQLLPCLHDADAEVRRLCEAALIARGLRPEYLELGRLLTDPRPAMRLQVLDCLRGSTELDRGLWLRRLSHDSAPCVRAAALRAMTQQTFVDLSDRIDQMARDDPSPTVCQLARFYRHSRKRD